MNLVLSMWTHNLRPFVPQDLVRGTATLGILSIVTMDPRLRQRRNARVKCLRKLFLLLNH